MTRTHVPVLAGELIDALGLSGGGPAVGERGGIPHGTVAVDCTFGAGGHARLVAERLGDSGELICIDRDPHAQEHFAELQQEVGTGLRLITGNYADVLPVLRAEGLRADTLYMDLGISSMQVDARERGFSYSYEAPLDMRMDTTQDLDARTIVNEWPEERVAATIRQFGEERYARQIAREVVRRRTRAPIETTSELVDAIKRAVPRPAHFAGGHPARRTFQAIRIAVNDELGSLERALPAAWDLLRPGGRMAAISFHSLEDRLVKHFFVDRARGCVCPPDLPVCVCGHEPEAELISRRAVRPSEGEVADNPRAASGRLRAAIKLREDTGP